MVKENSPIYKVLLFSAAVIWGASFFMVKDAVAAVPVNMLLAIRFFTAAAILAIVFHNRLKEHLDRAIVVRGCLLGLLLFLGYFIQTAGIVYTTPGKNAFLTAAYCVIVPFLFWAVTKVKPDVYNIAAAILLVAGVGFVSLTGVDAVNIGDVLTLCSAFFYAAHIVAVARFSRRRDVIVLTIFQFAAAGTLAFLLFMLLETPPSPSIWTPSVVAEVAYLAVAATAVALLFQNIGQKHVHPATASILLSLESVFGVLFSILLYGETVTPALLTGFTLIFAAVVVSETKLSFLPFLHRAAVPAPAGGERPPAAPGESGLPQVEEEGEETPESAPRRG